MPSKEEILSGLNALQDEVTNARERLLKGEVTAIDQVNQRIDDYCQAITELEPEDAVEIKPVLDNLLGDLQVFAEEIAYVQKKVVEILKAQQEDAKENEE